MVEVKKKAARIFLYRNKIYKMMASVFGLVGFGLFIYFYAVFIEGSPGILLQRPILVLYLFLPFIPSIILYYLSERARRNAGDIISGLKSMDGRKKR